MLIVLSGLPGSGKTSIAKALCQRIGAAYLRIDTIEQALRSAGTLKTDVFAEGYIVAYGLAEENLRLGRHVIADCVNPIDITRKDWHAAAGRAGAEAVDVEIICSDQTEHRRRVETRSCDIADLRLPSWQKIMSEDYHAWTMPRILIDSAGRTIESCVAELARQLHF